MLYIDDAGKRQDDVLHEAILEDGDDEAAKAISDRVKDRILAAVGDKIVKRTINGKSATVAFIDEDFNPCTEETAQIAKVIYDDGKIEFVSMGDELGTDDEAAGVMEE